MKISHFISEGQSQKLTKAIFPRKSYPLLSVALGGEENLVSGQV